MCITQVVSARVSTHHSLPYNFQKLHHSALNLCRQGVGRKSILGRWPKIHTGVSACSMPPYQTRAFRLRKTGTKRMKHFQALSVQVCLNQLHFCYSSEKLPLSLKG